MLKLIRKQMADYLTKVFCLLALIFGQPASSVFANINFDEYRESREAAISQIKSGKTKLGLLGLVKLSENGDGVSSHTLGLFYLMDDNPVVRPGVNKAVRLFALGASQCYAPSLRVLKKNFYGNKSSKYFDLNKLAVVEASCKKKQELQAEKENKEAEERRKAEAKRKEAEEQRKAEVKRKEAEEQRKAEAKRKETEKEKTTTPEEEEIIEAETVFAWSKILPSFGKPVSTGSGFAINSDGYFLTNHHVIDDCSKLSVQYNGLNGVAKTIIFSEDLDLAIIKVDAPTPYFGKFDNTKLKGGESLVAVGYPVSFIFGDGPTVSEGTLTNTGDTETMLRRDGFLMTSVPMTNGNSGGPILSSLKGIRGVAAAVADIPELEAFLKKEYGNSPTLSNLSFGLMVSGQRAYRWIIDNASFVKVSESRNMKKSDTQLIAETGLKILAKVNCFED